MDFYHKNLAAGGWQKFSLAEQLANVGSEVSRAIKWRGKDEKIYQNTIDRGLELLDLTIMDKRWRPQLKELTRAREVFCDAILGGKEYKSNLEDLNKYFFQFAVLTRREK